MKIQKTDWGRIRWDDIPGENGRHTALNTGTVVLNPHAHQLPHIHYEEQVLYILSGHGLCYVNGDEFAAEPGASFHWPAGILHEMINTGEEPLIHALVSNPPGTGEESAPGEAGEGGEEALEDAREESEPELGWNERAQLLYGAIMAVRTQSLDAMNIPYAVLDCGGNLVARARTFPDYCKLHCDPLASPDASACMLPPVTSRAGMETESVCPHGLTILSEPLFFRGQYLGQIRGGYLRESGEGASGYSGPALYDSPLSAELGARGLLRKTAKMIRNFCEFEKNRCDLQDRDRQIRLSRASQEALVRSLRESEYSIADLRINHHFLFNTLNTMASMALDTDNMTLYQAIVDLSKMFHYTLRNTSVTAEIRQELQYLKAYLQLQKLRTGADLSVAFEVPEELLGRQIPFNLLQPLAENAFHYGFLPGEEKKLILRITPRGTDTLITLENSGRSMTEEEIQAINEGMRQTTTHGLSMIRQKLENLYGDRYVFEAAGRSGGGMKIRILIPGENEVRA